jgi:hypothetical protein
MGRYFFIGFFILSVSVSAQDQQQFGAYFKAGTHIPFIYSIGGEFVIYEFIGIQAQYGIVAQPYKEALFWMITQSNDDPRISRLIRSTIKVGHIITIGPNFHFEKNYIGTYFQQIHLRGRNTSSQMVQDYYDTDFPSANPVTIRVRSNMHQWGLLYGRRFPLNENFQIHTEASISQNIGSKNRFWSSNRFLDNTPFVQDLYDEIDKGFRRNYRDHGFIPTVNVFFVYRFGIK